MSLRVDTVNATVTYTVCRADVFPGLVVLSVGQARQTPADYGCYPSCQGVCAGGAFDGAACGGASDLSTCLGGGNCSVYSVSLRTCFPNESTALVRPYAGPFALTQANTSALGGASLVVTAWAQRAGLAPTPLASQAISLAAGVPRVTALGAASPTDPGAYAGVAQLNFSSASPQARFFYTLDGVTDPAAAGARNCTLVPGLGRAVYNYSAGVAGCRCVFDPAAGDVLPILTRSATVWAVASRPGLAPSQPARLDVRVELAPVRTAAVGYRPDGALCPASAPRDCVALPAYQAAHPNSACCYTALCDPASGAPCPPPSEPGGGVVFPLARTGPTDLWCADPEGASCAAPPPPTAGFVVTYVFLSLYDAGAEACAALYAAAGLPALASMCPAAALYYNVTPGAAGWPATAYVPSAAAWARGGLAGFNLSAPGQWFPVGANATVRAFAALGDRAGPVSAQPIYVRTPCPRGWTSPDGLWPCAPCPADTYFAEPCGGLFDCACVPCPAGQGTSQPAAVGFAACAGVCAAGTYGAWGLQGPSGACAPCSRGTYQPAARASACIACPRGLTTEMAGATALYQCRGVAGVSAGGFHSCGVAKDGTAVCWGLNSFGCASRRARARARSGPQRQRGADPRIPPPSRPLLLSFPRR